MSTHYEERIAADLAEIRRKLKTVSDLVERQIRLAVQALLDLDRDLAAQVVLGDRQVNRRIKQLDELCHAFIVRHAPSAGHLRFVSAVLRFDVALERIGDYASEIGRQVAQIEQPPPGNVARDLELIAHQSRHTLSEALQAFHTRDAGLALRTYGLSKQTDLTLETTLEELLHTGEKRSRPLEDFFALARAAKLLKRVADQSENICDQVIFAATGEAREASLYRILFVDEENARGSQIAEAYAHKAFPESGTYESAGWNPTKALDPELIDFLDAKGVDVRRARPTALAPLQDAAEHFNVVVVMGSGARERLGDVPYRTTVVEWDLEGAKDDTEEDLEALYREIAFRVRDLMTTVAGPEAR